MLTVTERNNWLINNMNLIHKVCGKFRGYHIVEYDDLVAQAQMIALDCLSKFDTEKAKTSKIKISTYVYTNIRGYLQQYLVRNARSHKIKWSDISSAPEDISIEKLLDENNIDVIGYTYNKPIGLNLTKIKELLSPLEYEVLLSEYDIDLEHNFEFNDVIDMVKASLYPLVHRKLELNQVVLQKI